MVSNNKTVLAAKIIIH